MRIAPLQLHASARLPALTALLSDPIATASMTVVAGGLVTIVTAAPHGYPIGQRDALSIVDADTPNPITAAIVTDHGHVQITTHYGHDLNTRVIDGNSRNAWNETAKLAGFTSSILTGAVQLVSVDGPTTFTVNPSQTVSALTLTGNEALLERLEQGIIGWHACAAINAIMYTFATPEDVVRSYTVSNPRIVRNIRISGAVNIDVAYKQYVRGYQSGLTDQIDAEIAKSWMFITPRLTCVLSRDRNSRSDAVSEITPASSYRQLLMDGFSVHAFIPAENSNAGVSCSDLANGELLAAVLRTFHGLSLPRSELAQGDVFVCIMTDHMQQGYNGATYVHSYNFEAPAYLSQEDAIQAFEWSRINETAMTASSGLGPGTIGASVLDTGSIIPSGSVAFRDILFAPVGGDGGIQHDDAAGVLTARVSLPLP